MTRKKIVKSLSEMIATEVGAFASISDVVRITGYNRNLVSKILRKCEPFGEGKQKKFFCEDIAEAFGREM